MSQPAWLRGPVPDIPQVLQPVAHALIDADEDVQRVLPQLTDEQLWARPSGIASVGFHVRHALNSLDRLLTYARGETLSDAQLHTLSTEKALDASSGLGPRQLATEFVQGIARAHEQLRTTDVGSLFEERLVGRARVPATHLGLLFHAAEHTARHVGQLVTTAKLVRG